MRKLKFFKVSYGPQLKSSIDIDREAVTVCQLRRAVARGYGAPTRFRAVTVRHSWAAETTKSDEGLRCANSASRSERSDGGIDRPVATDWEKFKFFKVWYRPLLKSSIEKRLRCANGGARSHAVTVRQICEGVIGRNKNVGLRCANLCGRRGAVRERRVTVRQRARVSRGGARERAVTVRRFGCAESTVRRRNRSPGGNSAGKVDIV